MVSVQLTTIALTILEYKHYMVQKDLKKFFLNLYMINM